MRRLKSKGQALVETALALPLILFVILEGFQLSVVSLRFQQLQFSTMEAAWAGAQETEAPRCEVAQAAFNNSFPRLTVPIVCTEVDENFTVVASYDVAIVSPFHEDPDGFWTITSEQTAKIHNLQSMQPSIQP